MKKLSASILSADFGRLAEQVRLAEQAGVDWIHVDVMDGHFVPNITIGPDVVKAIKKATSLPLDVHLMIDNPERYVKDFVEAGADWLGIHVEATVHLERLIQNIKELGAKATVTLNPATSLNCLEYVLKDVDMVLLMTVNPGFSGQKFIRGVLPKVRQLRQRIEPRILGCSSRWTAGCTLTPSATSWLRGPMSWSRGQAFSGNTGATAPVKKMTTPGAWRPTCAGCGS